MVSDPPEYVWIGPWRLDTASGELTDGVREEHLEPRVVDVLLLLIRNAGSLVTRDQFLEEVWEGRVLTDDVLSRCIREARRALGDDASPREFIETLPRRGYRLVAEVRMEPELPKRSTEPIGRGSRPIRSALMGMLVLPLIVALAWFYLSSPRYEPAFVQPSIAVLPFANLSAEPGNEYFTAGMHEEILTTLARLKPLRVISRTSVLQFRPGARRIEEIHAELGVSHVLEGSVRRDANHVRFTVQLIDARKDVHLWAESYDRNLTTGNLFDVQRAIALAVAGSLNVALSRETRGRFLEVPTTNLEAYEAYLKGRQALARRTVASLEEAEHWFQHAIGLDPDFSLPHSHLADTYNLQSVYAEVPISETRPKAIRLVERSLELDPDRAEPWSTLGFIRNAESDYRAAEAAFRKALAINSNHVDAHHWYGVMLLNQGRFDEALARYEEAIDLDPLSSLLRINRAVTLEYLGRFDEAMQSATRAIELEPSHARGYGATGELYWHSFGQLDKALAYLLHAQHLAPADPARVAPLVLLYLDLGAPEEARTWLNRGEAFAPDSYALAFARLMLHVYRGEREQATAVALRIMAREGRQPPEWPVLCYFQNVDLERGAPRDAAQWIERAHPELAHDRDPVIDYSNWEVALNLAMVWQHEGRAGDAQRLLNRVKRVAFEMPARGANNGWLARTQVEALLGNREEALRHLSATVDEGWRSWWWYHLRLDPTLSSLHDDLRYQSLVQNVEEEIARQRVRASEIGPAL